MRYRLYCAVNFWEIWPWSAMPCWPSPRPSASITRYSATSNRRCTRIFFRVRSQSPKPHARHSRGPWIGMARLSTPRFYTANLKGASPSKFGVGWPRLDALKVKRGRHVGLNVLTPALVAEKFGDRHTQLRFGDGAHMIAGHHGVPAIRQGGGQRLGRAVVVVLSARQHERRHPDPRERLAWRIDGGVKNMEQRHRIAADCL